VQQFAKAKRIGTVRPKLSPERLPEKEVKAGLSRLLKETKIPKDWGA
jgi:hypothetical protein